MSAYYKNKVVVITGASSGIGEQIVRQLLEQEAKVVLLARSRSNMESIVSTFLNSNTLIIPVDFASQPNFASITQQIITHFGKVDVLINNAGIAQKSLVPETTEEVERKVMEVNYFATINLTKALLPFFIKQGYGQIAVVSSILGEIGLPFVAPYCASKHAINGYFNSLRYDVEKYNIQVHIISPGFIKTEITKKSLTGSGEVYNKDSVAQEKGMDANKCAYGILKTIKNAKRQAYIGGTEVNMPKFARAFPKLFHVLMKKMHKI